MTDIYNYPGVNGRPPQYYTAAAHVGAPGAVTPDNGRAQGRLVNYNHWATPAALQFGTIDGSVKIGATPAQRRVLLLDGASLRIVDSAWSADDGTYTFNSVVKGYSYLVVAQDYAGVYNAVVADRVTPV